MKGLRYIAFCAAVGLFAACGGVAVRTTVTDVCADGWEEPVTLKSDNADTVALHDMGIFLRCNRHFAEDSLTLHIVVHTPDSLCYEEPFLLTVASGYTPTALRREIVAAYRRRIRFRRVGEYRIRITPCRSVEGVEAVGITLGKAEE